MSPPEIKFYDQTHGNQILNMGNPTLLPSHHHLLRMLLNHCISYKTLTQSHPSVSIKQGLEDRVAELEDSVLFGQKPDTRRDK